jgi:predicted nucleic acid-binding protein
MRFWDSSALVPLLVREELSEAILDLYRREEAIATWWGSPVECASAIARLERDGNLTRGGVSQALRRLDELAGAWNEVSPSEPLRETARRLLRTHDLRAADGLQLAAAVVASEGRPPTLGFVTLDDRLLTAADQEGFAVLGRAELA